MNWIISYPILLLYGNTWALLKLHFCFTNNVGEHLISFPDSPTGLKELKNYQNEQSKCFFFLFTVKATMTHVTGGKKFWDLKTELVIAKNLIYHDPEKWHRKIKTPLVCSLPMSPSQYKLVFVAQSLGLQNSRQYNDLRFHIGVGPARNRE